MNVLKLKSHLHKGDIESLGNDSEKMLLDILTFRFIAEINSDSCENKLNKILSSIRDIDNNREKFCIAYSKYIQHEPQLACDYYRDIDRTLNTDSFIEEWNAYASVFSRKDIHKYENLSENYTINDCGKSGVIITACDSEYYDLYGETFIRSIKLLNIDLHVHIHILNGSVQPEVEGVSFSYEEYSGGNSKQYYALARYFISPSIMEKFGGQAYICDIDVLLNEKFKSYSKKCLKSNYDIVAISPYFKSESDLSHKRMMPWRAVKAGILYVGNIKTAILIKHMMKDNISSSKWWADQSVLFSLFSFRNEFDINCGFEQGFYMLEEPNLQLMKKHDTDKAGVLRLVLDELERMSSKSSHK